MIFFFIIVSSCAKSYDARVIVIPKKGEYSSNEFIKYLVEYRAQFTEEEYIVKIYNSKRSFDAIAEYMGYLYFKRAIILDNIANYNTPGFKLKTVRYNTESNKIDLINNSRKSPMNTLESYAEKNEINEIKIQKTKRMLKFINNKSLIVF